MKLYDVLEGIEVLGGSAENVEVSGISCDSRTIQPGEIFVAISGYEADGHEYIRQAALKGAAAVICQSACRLTIPVVLVENARRALALVAANFYGHPAKELTMLGVTGTNGKTTTTYLLKAVLEELIGTKVGIIGTNSHTRTTPESLELQRILRTYADDGYTHVVMEVSSHALVLERVCGIRFHTGIFTNLTQDHLDFHPSMEAYAAAKASLFFQCDYGIINADDAYGRQFLQTVPCPCIRFSTQRFDADLTAEEIALFPTGVAFTASYQQRRCPVQLPIPGGFSVQNALGVIGAACMQGLEFGEVCAALQRCAAVKGRLERVDCPSEGTVIIDYAHTPDALENVLSSLRPFTYGRLICLFGCGGDRDRSKRPLMGSIASRYADLLVITSDNPRSESPLEIIREILAGITDYDAPVIVEPDRRSAIAIALAELRAGDTLLLAGKGHESYQEISGVRRQFDEREVIADFYRGKNEWS